MVSHLHPCQLLRDILHLAHSLWAQDDTKIHCNNIATGQPLLSTYPNVERAVDVCSRAEEHLPVEYSIFVFPLHSFLSTEEFAQLALQENEPRVDMHAVRFPSYDRAHSSDHALVSTAESLMNFCLSLSDSDHLMLQFVLKISTSSLFAICWTWTSC